MLVVLDGLSAIAAPRICAGEGSAEDVPDVSFSEVNSIKKNSMLSTLSLYHNPAREWVLPR